MCVEERCEIEEETRSAKYCQRLSSETVCASGQRLNGKQGLKQGLKQSASDTEYET